MACCILANRGRGYVVVSIVISVFFLSSSKAAAAATTVCFLSHFISLIARYKAAAAATVSSAFHVISCHAAHQTVAVLFSAVAAAAKVAVWLPVVLRQLAH